MSCFPLGTGYWFLVVYQFAAVVFGAIAVHHALLKPGALVHLTIITTLLMLATKVRGCSGVADGRAGLWGAARLIMARPTTLNRAPLAGRPGRCPWLVDGRYSCARVRITHLRPSAQQAQPALPILTGADLL